MPFVINLHVTLMTFVIVRVASFKLHELIANDASIRDLFKSTTYQKTMGVSKEEKIFGFI